MKDLWRIITFARRMWPVYIGISLLTVLLAAIAQVHPILLKEIIDSLANATGGQVVDASHLIWLVGIMMTASLADTLISNYSGYLGDLMSARLNRHLADAYAKQLMSLGQSYFDQQQTGAIVNKLNRATTSVTNFFNSFANNFFSMLATCLFSLIILTYFFWPAALLITAMYPTYFYFTNLASRHWQKQQKLINDISDVAYGRFNQMVGQIKVLRAFTREQQETGLFSRRLGQIIKITRRQSHHWHKQDVLRRVFADVFTFIALALVVYQATAGNLSVGTVVLVVTYTNQLRWPLFALSFLFDNAQRAMAGSREFFEVMELKPELKDDINASTLDVTQPDVVFDNVSFAYQGGSRVIERVSFTIASGQKLALVGESGQGKSTISNLLLRLYEPTSGRILIDGVDISQITQHSLRSQIGVVFQDPSLFSGTIKDNIALGKNKAKLSEVEAAAKAANAHEFIMKLDKGYNSEIGERGIKLSGGQQQRIAIARAIIANPPILILDEATSSLDSKAEAQVQSALDYLMSGRTTLIIAHRLSTIKDVDTIVTLKNGGVDEIGSPKDLAKSEGIYAQLLSLQQATGAKREALLKRYDFVE